ncbi:hypothetical protein MACK_001162 [Theileria orientalis]|uniref:Chorein N-terminal domain-containing protein n=1 Tax=Theileria orientalis TaxID=68886 RepID=A0A976MCJ1_THEOR|nr:hypothetical protein MACK_001162 [Theileria orientalis]
MLKYILNGLIRTFGRELVEEWIPLDHVCVTSVGNPEIHLADIAIPEIVFQNYSSPFALVSSNISRIVVKCDWSAFFRSNKRGKIKIDVDGVDLVVRTKRLDEFDPDLCKKLLLSKKKRYLDKWTKYSKLGANADKAAKIVNCLSIRVKNVKVTFVDDVIYRNPFSIVIRADLVTGGGVDSKNPNMNDLERKGFLKGLFTNLLFKTRGVQIEYNSYENYYSNYDQNYSDDLDTDVGTDSQESDSCESFDSSESDSKEYISSFSSRWDRDDLSSSSSNFTDELFESDFSEKEEMETRELYDFLEVKRSNFCTFCSSCMPPEKISKNKINPDSIKYLNILNTPHKRFKLTTKQGIFVAISVKIWNFNSLFFVDRIAYEPMQKIKLYLCGNDAEYANQEHYGYLFDGSVKYSQLKLNFSSEFVHTLHDFIRYVRILSSFKKGATNDLWKMPSVQSSVKYCNLLKKSKLFNLSEEDQEFFDAYERETPLGVLIRLRSSLSKKRRKIIKSDVNTNKSSKYANNSNSSREEKSKTTKINDKKTNLSDDEDAEQDFGIKIERLFQDEDEYKDEYNEQFIRNFINIQADEWESNFFTSNYCDYMNATSSNTSTYGTTGITGKNTSGTNTGNYGINPSDTSGSRAYKAIRMALGVPNSSSNDDHWFLGNMSFGIIAPNLRVDLIPTSKILNSFNEANRRKGSRRKMLDCIIAEVSNFYFNIVQISDRRTSIKIFLARAMCRYGKVECHAKKHTFSCDLVLGSVHNEMLVAAPSKLMEDYEGYFKDYGNEDVDEFSLEDFRQIDKHSLISILIESYGNYVKKNVINMCSYFLIANPALELYKSVERGLVTRTLNELLSFEMFLHRTFTNNHRNQYGFKTTDADYPFKNVTQYSKEDLKMIDKFVGKLDEKLRYVIMMTRQRMCMKNRNMVRFTGKEMKMYSFFARFAKKRTRVDAKDMYEQNEQSLLKWPYQKGIEYVIENTKEARRRTMMLMANSSSNISDSLGRNADPNTNTNSIGHGRVNNDVVVLFDEEMKDVDKDLQKINHWEDVDWFYNARSVPFCIESLDLGFNNSIEVSMKGLDVLVDSYLSSKKLTFNDIDLSMINIYNINDQYNTLDSAPAKSSADKADTKTHNRPFTKSGATSVIHTSAGKPVKDGRNDNKTSLLSVELFSFQLIKNSGVFVISLDNVELHSNLVVLVQFHQFANEFAESGNDVKNMVDAIRDGSCFPNFYAYFNFKPDYSRNISSALDEFEYDSMIKVGKHMEMEARVYNMVSCYCTPIYEPDLIRFHGDYENKVLVSVRDLKIFFLKHDRSTNSEGGIAVVATNDHTLLYSLVFHKLTLQLLKGNKEKIKLNLKGANLLSHRQVNLETSEDNSFGVPYEESSNSYDEESNNDNQSASSYNMNGDSSRSSDGISSGSSSTTSNNGISFGRVNGRSNTLNANNSNNHSKTNYNYLINRGNYEVLFGCSMNDMKNNKITTKRVQHGQVLVQVEKVRGNTEVKLELRSLNFKYNQDFVDYCFQQFLFFSNLIQRISSSNGLSSGTGTGNNEDVGTSVSRVNNRISTIRNSNSRANTINSGNFRTNTNLNTSGIETFNNTSNDNDANTFDNNNNSVSTTSDTRSSTEDSEASEGAYQDVTVGGKCGQVSGSVKMYVSSLNTFVYLDSFGVVLDMFCELTKKNNSLSLNVARLSTGLLWSNYKRFLTLSLMDLQFRLDDYNVFKTDYEGLEHSDCLMDLGHMNNKLVLQLSQLALWYHYNNSYTAYNAQTESNKFSSVGSSGRKYNDLKEVFYELSLLFNEYWFSHVTWCLLPTCSDEDVVIPIFSTKVSSYSRLKPIMNRSYVKSYMKMVNYTSSDTKRGDANSIYDGDDNIDDTVPGSVGGKQNDDNLIDEFLNGIEVVEKYDSLQVDTNLILHRFSSVLTTKGSVEVGEFLFNFDMSMMKEVKQYASEVQDVLDNIKNQVTSFKSMCRGTDDGINCSVNGSVSGKLGDNHNIGIGGSFNFGTNTIVATNGMYVNDTDYYDDESNEGEDRESVDGGVHKKGFVFNVDFSLKGSASFLFSDYSLTVPCWYLPEVTERYKRLRFRILKAYPQNKVMVNFAYSFNVLLQSNLDEDVLYKLSKHMDDNVGGSITGEGFEAKDNTVEVLYEQYYTFNGNLILTVSNCSFILDLYAKHPYNLDTGVYAQGGKGDAHQANSYHNRLSSINVFEEPLDEYELVKIFNLTLCKKVHFVKNEDRLLVKLLVEKLHILDYFGKYILYNVHEVRLKAAQLYYVPEELLSKQKEQIVLSLSKSANSKQVNVGIDNTLAELHPDFINLVIAIVMSQFGSSIQKRGVNKAISAASYGTRFSTAAMDSIGYRTNTFGSSTCIDANIITGTSKTNFITDTVKTKSGTDVIGNLKLSLTLNMFEIWIYPSIDFYTRTKKVVRETMEQKFRAIPRIFMTAESSSLPNHDSGDASAEGDDTSRHRGSSGSNYHDDRMHIVCILFSGTVSNNKYCRCHVKYLSTTLGAVLLLENNSKVLVDQNDALIISRMNDPCNRFLFEMKDLTIKFKIDADNVMIQSQLENIKVCNSIEDLARIYYLKDYFYPDRINDLIDCMKKPERVHEHEDQEAHEYEYKSLDDIFRSLGVVNTQKTDNVDGFSISCEDMDCSGSSSSSRNDYKTNGIINKGKTMNAFGTKRSSISSVRTAKSRTSVGRKDRKGSGSSKSGSKGDSDKEKIKKAFKALDRLYYLGRRKISVSVEVSKLQLIILTNPEPMILGLLVNELNFEVSCKSQQLNTSSVFSLSFLFEVALLNNKFGVIDALMQQTPFGLELIANGAINEEDEKRIDKNVLMIKLELGAATVDFSNNMSRLMNYLITTLKRIKEIEKTIELNRITVYNELEYDICVFSGNAKRELDYFVVPNNTSVKLFTKEFAVLIRNQENLFSNCENLLGYIDNNLLYGNTNNVKDFINLHNYTNSNKINAANKRISNVNVELNDTRNNYIYLGRFEGSESILKLPSVGEVILVEKLSDKVVVSTNVKIENLTDITLVIRCRNYYGFKRKSKFLPTIKEKINELSGSLDDMDGVDGTTELVLDKFTSAGIPISWYTNKFTPLITYADNTSLNKSYVNTASSSYSNRANSSRYERMSTSGYANNMVGDIKGNYGTEMYNTDTDVTEFIEDLIQFELLKNLLNNPSFSKTNNSYYNTHDEERKEYLLKFKNGLCFKTTLTSTVVNDIDEVDCVKYVITIEPTLRICNKLPFDLLVYFSTVKQNSRLDFKETDVELKETTMDLLVYDKVDSMSIVENNGAVKLVRPNQSWGIPVHNTKFYVKLLMKGVALVNTSRGNYTQSSSVGRVAFDEIDTDGIGGFGENIGSSVSFGPEMDMVQDSYDDASGSVRGEKYSVVEYLSQFGNMSEMNERHLVYQSDLFEINLPNTVDLVATKCLKYASGPIYETTFKHFEPLLSRGAYSRNKEVFYEVVKNSFVNIRLDRDKISVFWPYIFENFTNNFISLNGNLIPPHFKYFSTNRQAKNANLRAYVRQESGQYVPSKEVNKLDFTSTTATRPPINLAVQTSSKEGKSKSSLKDGARLLKHSTNPNEESEALWNERTDVLEESNTLNSQGAKLSRLSTDWKSTVSFGKQETFESDTDDATGDGSYEDSGAMVTTVGGDVGDQKGTGAAGGNGSECVSLGCTVRALNISAHPTRIVAFHSYYRFINGMKHDLIIEHSSYCRTVIGPNEEVEINTTLKTIRMLITTGGSGSSTTSFADTITNITDTIASSSSVKVDGSANTTQKGNAKISACTISLTPPKIPFNMQIRAKQVNKEPTKGDDEQLILHISVVEGKFEHGLPCHFNGLYFIVSEAKDTTYQLLNLTRFDLYVVDPNFFQASSQSESSKKGDTSKRLEESRRMERLERENTMLLSRLKLMPHVLFNNNDRRVAFKNSHDSEWMIYNIDTLKNVHTYKMSRFGKGDPKDSVSTTSASDSLSSSSSSSSIMDDSSFTNSMIMSGVETTGANSGYINVTGATTDSSTTSASTTCNTTSNTTLKFKETLEIFVSCIMKKNGTRVICFLDNYILLCKLIERVDLVQMNRITSVWSKIVFTFATPRITTTMSSKKKLVLAAHLNNLQFNLVLTNNFHLANLSNVNGMKSTKSTKCTLSGSNDWIMDLMLTINGCHIDHFVQGFIPVILKTLTNRHSVQESFLVFKTTCNIFSKSIQTFDNIYFKLSPISMNVEMRVIEQIVDYFESLSADNLNTTYRAKSSSLSRATSKRGLTDVRVSTTSGGKDNRVVAIARNYTQATVSGRSDTDPDHSVTPGKTTKTKFGTISHGTSGGYGYYRSPSSLRVARAELVRKPAEGPVASVVKLNKRDKMNKKYFKKLIIEPITVVLAIRTSDVRLTRQGLQILDALPVDTPSVCVHFFSEKIYQNVCSFEELFSILKNSYFKQLVRQSLPTAWLSNSLALLYGVIKGSLYLVTQPFSCCKKFKNTFEGFLIGINNGIKYFVLFVVGGLAQSVGHLLNIFYKLMGRGRAKPIGILDGLWFGLNSVFLDLFYNPWRRLFSEFYIGTGIKRGFRNSYNIVKCIASPLTALVNLLVNIVEGLSNVLLGDFEQFTHLYETDQLSSIASTGESLKVDPSDDKKRNELLRKMKTVGRLF